jgi:AraC-like DNA-binding protein
MLKEGSSLLNNSAIEHNVLDDVIDVLRFRGTIFFHSNLASPWGMSLSSIEAPRFHVALEGGFYIGIENTQLSVAPTDIVMLPTGDMHWIADEVNRKLIPSELAGEACELGSPLFQDGKITNRVMCGLVEYDNAILHPIIDALPKVFHLTNIKPDDSIWITVKQIDMEIQGSKSKKNILIDRLTEVLFIQLLNRYVNDNEQLTGFFAALRNPRITKVLRLIHNNPEKPWTLDIISSESSMSRATLQRKFKAELGVSPMIYLNHWRMAKAYQLVKYSNLTFDDIAERVGFSDARTLRIAFQRHYDCTPSEIRKNVNDF